MKKKRIIPILLFKNGWLVQSTNFSIYKNLGNPMWSARRLSEWASDEMIYLDISRDDSYDLRRDDLKDGNKDNFLEIIEDVAKVSFMPMAVGGKIRTKEDIRNRLKCGADKITINTKALEEPDFITQAANEFGSQCIIVSIDVRKENGIYRVMAEGGKRPSKYQARQWAQIAERCGAGEILLNSIDRDGMKNGFEIPLIAEVADAISIPLIACGGAGEWDHFAEVFEKTGADAVAAANIFQHVDQSVYLAKKYLFDKNFNVRCPDILKI